MLYNCCGWLDFADVEGFDGWAVDCCLGGVLLACCFEDATRLAAVWSGCFDFWVADLDVDADTDRRAVWAPVSRFVLDGCDLGASPCTEFFGLDGICEGWRT
jgi:hypothetical protein